MSACVQGVITGTVFLSFIFIFFYTLLYHIISYYILLYFVLFCFNLFSVWSPLSIAMSPFRSFWYVESAGEREREREGGEREMIEGEGEGEHRGRGTEREGCDRRGRGRGKEPCYNIQNRYCMQATMRAATSVRPPVHRPRVLRRVPFL